MRAIRYATLVGAVFRRNLFNTALGYPKDGICADGSAPPPGVGVTLRCASIFQRILPPNAFAIQESDEMLALEGTVVNIGAGLREDIPEVDWHVLGGS